MVSPEIERFEERGFFLTIPFSDEDDSTVLYVADQDFETLKELLDDADTSWQEFRDEIIELLDHSGHAGDHNFSRELVENLMDVVRNQPRPEESEIDDPLDDPENSKNNI